MTEQLIFDGRLHSPFSLFIRQPHSYTDKELLSIFNLGHYRRNAPTKHGRHTIFADADGWTLMSDDWYYTLSQMKTTRPAIQKIARSHNVFACTEGDCDRAFEYVYYVDGEPIREYVVHSPGYSDRQIHTDRGTPLPDERELLEHDGYNIGIDVAASLGIKTRFTDNDLRVFVPPHDIELSHGAE